MSDAAPKPWVKALRIKSTPWRVLVGLWGHGSYKADGPAFVWVNRGKLAEEIGLPLGTLRNGLDALAVLGWIVRDGGGWRLAWMTPGNFARPAGGPTRPTGEPARPQADPARGETDPARPQADPRPAGGPHNLYGTSNYLSSEVDDAHASGANPDTHEELTHGDTTRGRTSSDDLAGNLADGRAGQPAAGLADARIVRCPSPSRSPALPAHVEANLARAQRRGSGRDDPGLAPAVSIEHRLPLDAWQACYDCGWGHMTEFAWWRKSLIEALETMTVVELKRVLDAWNAAAPGARPVRRELWYRGSKWRRSVAFVDGALGRQGAERGRHKAPASSEYNWDEADLLADLQAGRC